MTRKDNRTVSRSEQIERGKIVTTSNLIWAVVLISIAVTAVTELRIAGYGSFWISAVAAYAAFFLNIACSGFGFRTPERMWWLGNVGVNVATMSLIGAPTIPSALWTAGRVLLAR